MIRVRSDLLPVVAAEVLLHETLHAAFYSGCLEDGDSEERIVGTLATQLAQVWRDNPELVAFISESLA